MKYAFFQGCNIPIRIEQYARSTQSILANFGVELTVVEDFNCCGYPVRNVDEKAYFLPSARNLALAERLGQDIMAICNCCYMSLQKARTMLEDDLELRAELNTILAKEGLKYTGKVQVTHFLAVLHQDIGLETLRKGLVHKFTELKLAVLHGCHLLRPREITQFDDSFAPRITGDLMNLIGVDSLDWRGRLECCGAALAGINNDLATTLLAEKIEGAQEAGAEFITPICSYCHLQLDTAQQQLLGSGKTESLLPVLLYPQLLGLCLGMSPQELGIPQNTTISDEDVVRLQALLGPPVEEKKRRRKKSVAA
jgi:heterodisulfide reductase subunit B